jgi:hypothetical protein
MPIEDLHIEELDISDTSDTEVTEEVYATLYQMKFEHPDTTNVASAMDVNDEIGEALILSESSDEDEEDSKDKSKEETLKERDACTKTFTEEKLGNVHTPVKLSGPSGRLATNRLKTL